MCSGRTKQIPILALRTWHPCTSPGLLVFVNLSQKADVLAQALRSEDTLIARRDNTLVKNAHDKQSSSLS